MTQNDKNMIAGPPFAEANITKAQDVMQGHQPDEPSMTDMFLRLREALNNVREFVADEFASEEDAAKLTELHQAKSLLSDVEEIVERAEQRAAYLYTGQTPPRIFLGTWKEYFTFDDTTATARYCK